MKKMIEEIMQISNSRKLTFSDMFYRSKDDKTIMGEVSLKEILFLDYRDSEAGSNPREYNGLQKANLEIFKSLLAHQDMFRFLHSGIIVSLTDTVIKDNTIKYADSCLTNGNQTRFVILIITLLRLFSKERNLTDFDFKEYQNFVKTNFGDNQRIMPILKQIKPRNITQAVNILKGNSKYLNCFNNLKLDKLLNSKIRILLNLIDQIVDDLEDPKVDVYAVGTLIAQANNDTQKVKVDDIFGNKYKSELREYIFKVFLEKFKDKFMIEYRTGEIVEKVDKVHILPLLRPIVALGLLTKEKNICHYTNHRGPVYTLFEKILRVKDKDKPKNTIEAISKLIPVLFGIRITYVVPNLDLLKKTLVREYTLKAIDGELDTTIIHKDILSAKGDEKIIEKIIRKNVKYSIEHIFPVLVFRIRKLFEESNSGEQIRLTISDTDAPKFFKSLTEVIYRKYVDQKLGGLPTSLTTLVRSPEFYQIGEETYISNKHNFDLEETDFIEKNKYVIG
jgi:hypothetical protein